MKLLRSRCYAAVILCASGGAFAQSHKISGDVVKIGVLTDMSRFLSDVTGEGAAVAVRSILPVATR